jgi:hypothetical protein
MNTNRGRKYFFIGKYDTIILRYSINVEDEIIIYTE